MIYSFFYSDSAGLLWPRDRHHHITAGTIPRSVCTVSARCAHALCPLISLRHIGLVILVYDRVRLTCTHMQTCTRGAHAMNVASASRSMNAAETSGVVVMPCLGRPFKLGTLYDRRNDSLIPGVTLWGPDTLGTVESKNMEGSNFEVITEDSLNKKMQHLDVGAELKLSLFSGLVKADGSGRFLYDRTTSRNQARVSLKYKSKSRFEQLDMSQLGKFEYPKVFEDDIATHVVTGVQYGADAVFVFDRQVDSTEKFHNIHGAMEAMISVLPSIDLQTGGSADLDIQSKDKMETEKIQCKFFGDVILPQNPTTYQDAVKVYQELPKLLGGAGYPNSVPKKVWLYPLSKLSSKVQRMVREISYYLIDDIQEVMETLHVLEVRVNDLIRNEVCVYFEVNKRNLEKLKRLIDGFKVTMMKDLSTLLPKVRRGGEEEVKLAELLEMNRKSPFSCEKISSWIKEKESEVSMLAVYLKELEKHSIQFAFQPDEMVTLTSGFTGERVLCFDFNIPAGKDAYLQRMENYLRGQQTVEQEHQLQNPWYKSQELRQQFRRFVNFAMINCNRQGSECKYVVTNGFGSTETNKVGIISVFVDSCETEFEPPVQPDVPCTTDVTHNSIQLSWGKPKYGSNSVQFYTVSYRSVDSQPDQWRTQTSSKECLLLNKLTPGSLNHFKVTAESAVGSSPASEVCEVRLPPSQPGKPHAIDITHNSVQLKWTKPEYGANIVNAYSISVEGDQRDALTSSDECVMLTKLTPGSFYCFKITAESDAGSSPASEVSEVRLPPDRPGKPHAIDKTHNSVRLEWTKPEYGASIVNSYSVYYHSEDGPTDQWNKQTSSDECVVLIKLTPGSLYYFKVTAESDAGSSPDSEENEVRLPPGQPGKPNSTNITHNSVRLKWTKPEIGTSIVNSYLIHYCSSVDDQWNTQTTTEESLELTELTPGTHYYFKVTAESAAGSSPASEVCEARLLPDQPGKPHATSKTHNSVQLEWTKPEHCAHIINIYCICYRSVDDPTDKWKRISSNKDCAFTITKLTPGTQYYFKVAAQSSVGSGPASEVGEVSLPPDQPGKPCAAEITQNSLRLEWAKPENGAHTVSTYSIYYRSVDDPTDQWARQTSSDECVVLTELNSGSLYRFKVTAESATGSSPDSEVSVARLPPGPPGKPWATNVTHNTIQLQWPTKPHNQVKSITSYTVLYRCYQFHEWSSHTTTDSQESALLTNLVPKRAYHVKVQAVSSAGTSSESEVSDIIETLLPPPGKPYANNVTHNGLQLLWKKKQNMLQTVYGPTQSFIALWVIHMTNGMRLEPILLVRD